MTDTHDFRGKILSDTNSLLGEGPTYDPDTDTVWWFNILGKELARTQPFHRSQAGSRPADDGKRSGARRCRAPADRDRGRPLSARRRARAHSPFMPLLEPGQPENRSNDGRTHISGALWIGTMGKRAETRRRRHLSRGRRQGDQALRQGQHPELDLLFAGRNDRLLHRFQGSAC